jgi:hypothetical protein
MKRWRFHSVLILAITAVYLYAYPSPTIFYFANVGLHMGLGILASLGLLVFLFREFPRESLLAKLGWLLLVPGAAVGIALIKLGTPLALRAHRTLQLGGCTAGNVVADSARLPWYRSTAASVGICTCARGGGRNCHRLLVGTQFPLEKPLSRE